MTILTIESVVAFQTSSQLAGGIDATLMSLRPSCLVINVYDIGRPNLGVLLTASSVAERL